MWSREGPVKSEAARESQIAQLASPARPLEERRVVAWVGQSVVFIGSLMSAEDMTIDGHIEGSIDVRDHAVTAGPDADIRADIVAKVVTIHGTVVGNIRASAKIEICATAHIDGELIAPSVAIADGAVVCGRVDTLTERSGAARPRGELAIA